jgi:hypothetical protein
VNYFEFKYSNELMGNGWNPGVRHTGSVVVSDLSERGCAEDQPQQHSVAPGVGKMSLALAQRTRCGWCPSTLTQSSDNRRQIFS